MDKLDIAIALLFDARDEKKRLESYNADRKKLPRVGEPGYYEALDKLDTKYKRIPTKAVVNDNIKMARRLLLEARV